VTVVGLVPHRDRRAARELATRAAAWLAERGVEVRLPAPEARAAGLADLAADPERFAEGLDLVVSLGGDGTMLHTVQLVHPTSTPILGVNVGHLGYLTAIEPDELLPTLPRLVAGDYSVSERMLLEVAVESEGAAAGTWYALNEAALEKVRAGRMIRLDVSVSGVAFTPYLADGLIVATPTGSTAYSLSVRGPIVSPALACTVVTPVAPHMLFDRTLVLAPDEDLGLVVADGRSVALTLDGREVGELVAGDRVRCRGADVPARMVVPGEPRDFHQLLKAKFGLPDR